MLIVAGLSLKNLQPRVWDANSDHFIVGLRAVMVSYADFHAMPARRKQAMDKGLREFLSVPAGTQVYLDNGSFYFLNRGGRMPQRQYEEFVRCARPDWYPIPRDFIPTPAMSHQRQQKCFTRTMEMNNQYANDGFVPVMHVSPWLPQYLREIARKKKLAQSHSLALGGIVPNLLRASKALPYADILAAVQRVRKAFPEKHLHVFGMGGTATLHLASLLELNSVDSSGWRNRAARGLIQLPGRGDRQATQLGSWKGRKLDKSDRALLEECACPVCLQEGSKSLRRLQAKGIRGFSNRATHNLWVLVKESEWIQEHLAAGTYYQSFRERLDNSIYLQLVEQVAETRKRMREREGETL